MSINHVVVQNYRSLRRAEVSFADGINIVVGNNEVGKSTLLEAINLAVKCQINRRSAHQELHPYLLNVDAVSDFIKSHKQGNPQPPPSVLIEVYLKDLPELATFKGTNNSKGHDCPGVSLRIQLDEERFGDEYKSYVAEPERLTSAPIEYYEVIWLSFANEQLSPKSIPLRTALVDAANSGNTLSAQKYVLEVIREFLTKDQSAKLAVAYRGMREKFQTADHIVEINAELKKKDAVSERELSIALDTTARASWEVGILPHLGNIPLPLVGKGEQNTLKIKLALEASSSAVLILIEEPENHLSHTNLGKLTSHFAEKCSGRQAIITTHSSFVMNKLGIESVIMFDGKSGVTLRQLPEVTYSYFKRLPGHDTLRMILATKTILVEGPSDELIVQRAYVQKYNKLPLELGHEVISVGTSFKRFLDIAKLLSLKVVVIADNDGKSERKKNLLKDYEGLPNIRICIDNDDTLSTLEPHLLKSNSRDLINRVITKSFATDHELLEYMIANKTDVAFKLFESKESVSIPKYIEDALQ